MLTRLIQRTDSVSEGSIRVRENARTMHWTEVLDRTFLNWGPAMRRGYTKYPGLRFAMGNLIVPRWGGYTP